MKPAFPSALAGGLGKGRIGALTPVRPVSLANNFIASNEIIIAHLFYVSSHDLLVATSCLVEWACDRASVPHVPWFSGTPEERIG